MGLTFEPGVAGCDEAGRGPLAGPVVCAAVILPQGFVPVAVADSKTLSRSAREAAARLVRREAIWAVEVVCTEEIEARNVLWASMEGMARALRALPVAPQLALIDGPHVPPSPPCPCRALVRGDSTDAAVAAASILAKVARDALMVELDKAYPGYGFARHFGYATREHLEALRRLGPCAAHRRKFAPVMAAASQPRLAFEGL